MLTCYVLLCVSIRLIPMDYARSLTVTHTLRNYIERHEHNSVTDTDVHALSVSVASLHTVAVLLQLHAQGLPVMHQAGLEPRICCIKYISRLCLEPSEVGKARKGKLEFRKVQMWQDCNS